MDDTKDLFEDQPDVSLRRVYCIDGVRTTLSDNQFTVCVDPKSEVWEQAVVQKLREWCRWRKRQIELRDLGNVPD